MTMLLHTRGFLLRLVNLCLVSSTAVKDSWMMTLQPAEEGMCLPPHLPRSLSPAVDSFVLWLCCQNRRKSLDHRRVAETQILSNPTLNSHTCTSSLWRVMMGLTNTPAELWFSLQKKKNLHLWILTSSVLWQSWAVRLFTLRYTWLLLLLLHLLLCEHSVWFPLKPNLRCSPPSPAETLLETTKHTSCFYLLAFSNVSFCHRPGLCALRVSHRVKSWYAGVTSLMWGRNGRLTESGTAVVCQVSCVLLSSTFCCQLKPFLVLGWWLCNLPDPHVCMWVEMYGSFDTLRILFSENGLKNQGSCWRNVAASHASVIVNVSETCCVFFFPTHGDLSGVDVLH